MSVLYKKAAFIGLGLIASSMAHAMRQFGLVNQITGHARSADTRRIAKELFCDEVYETAAEAVLGADLVVLAVPVGVMGNIAAEIAPHLVKGAVVTDVGSVKQSVVDAIVPHIPEGVHFIPGHPIAGTEHSGPRSGFATLFANRWWLLTPPEEADPDVVTGLCNLYEAMGANVELMSVAHHDILLAVTSHVPHLVAYTMVGVAEHMRRVSSSEVIKYSAGGFRDLTRIAASDPIMWRDVFIGNKEAVLDILGRFTEELFVLQRAIRMGDGDHLENYFSNTRHIRRSIIEAGQDTSETDFGRGYQKDSVRKSD